MLGSALIARRSGASLARSPGGAWDRPPIPARDASLSSEIRLRVLASGSSGNAAVLGSGRTRLLVEAGLYRKALDARLEQEGLRPRQIGAVLVSHEHGDHARGALTFTVEHGIPIACSRGTWERLTAGRSNRLPRWIRLRPGRPRRLGDVTVVPFPTPHDAAEPFGFRFESDDAAAVLVTDLGHLSEPVTEAIVGAQLLLVESNYDEEALWNSRYPMMLRDRIASRRGHLSNGALALYLRRGLPASVRTVVLAHLSANTNSPDLAERTARRALDAADRSEVRLVVASRRSATEAVSTAPPTPRPARRTRRPPSLFSLPRPASVRVRRV